MVAVNRWLDRNSLNPGRPIPVTMQISAITIMASSSV
ncbi:hypothetical protein XaFJ1_GM001854 [Xanthomonas albilineans]|nr:hypothetical protein XaFJ1_GM001854 [Xanthomonas albilineans]